MTFYFIPFGILPHYKAESVDVGRTAKASVFRRRTADYSATRNSSAPTSFPTDSPPTDSPNNNSSKLKLAN